MHFAPGAPVALPHSSPKEALPAYASGSDEHKASSNSLFLRLWKEDSGSTLAVLCQDDIELAFRMFLYGLEPSGRCAQGAATSIQTTRKRNTAGTLSQIKEMPLEIVFEIMSYLHPADLISLSRTSRRMREILLSKSSRLVWRTSLSNVRGLPACPIDMAEPQFANLIFGQNCQFCGKSGVKDIYWTCRARCCGNCVKSQFISEEKLEAHIPVGLGIEKLSSVFPYVVVNRYQPKTPSRILYHHPTAMRYLQELEAAMTSINPTEVISAWVTEKKANQIARIKHASVCEHWYNHWVARTPPPSAELPFFDLAVTAVLSSALVYLWKDRIFG